MPTKNFSITLPEELFEQVEELCHREHRSRSELIREALRGYIREAEDPPLHDWQREILAQRLAASKARPDEVQTWEEVESELWPS